MSITNLILLTLFSTLASCDIIFEFGYKPSEIAFPDCYIRNITEDQTATYTCGLKKSKFVSGVDVRLMGPARMIGGAKLDRKLGKQTVTVRVWNSGSQALDYEIFVYGDRVGAEYPDPLLLEGHVLKKRQ